METHDIYGVLPLGPGGDRIAKAVTYRNFAVEKYDAKILPCRQGPIPDGTVLCETTTCDTCGTECCLYIFPENIGPCYYTHGEAVLEWSYSSYRFVDFCATLTAWYNRIHEYLEVPDDLGNGWNQMLSDLA